MEWLAVRKFVHDMIHMSEGEKLLYYWWVWLAMIGVCLLAVRWIEKKGK